MLIADFPAGAMEFHCVRGKIMFLCHNPGLARDDAKGRAKAEHDSYRGEAATGLEEIVEIEPRLFA
jgi:hypothetical protein